MQAWCAETGMASPCGWPDIAFCVCIAGRCENDQTAESLRPPSPDDESTATDADNEEKGNNNGDANAGSLGTSPAETNKGYTPYAAEMIGVILFVAAGLLI